MNILKRVVHFFTPMSTSAPTKTLRAGDNSVQIGHITGDVYLTKKVHEASKVDVAEAVRLHFSLPLSERKSVIKWMQKEFGTGLIKDLDRANLGLALRYIRAVHKRVNQGGS